MKIVHILLTHSFAGTERHVVELANAQAALGHDVTVILHRRAAEDRPNAVAHRFDTGVKLRLVGGFSVLAAWAARRVLKQLAPEVAHAHLSGACRALRGLKGRFLRVATLHIHYKPQQHSDIDALIAIAPWQVPAVPAAQRAHTAQIDNWTHAASPDPQARGRIRAELGVAEDEFLIGALGRTEASKGLDVLVDAFAALPAPRARLVIVGAGRDWQALRARAPARIAMPGFVSRPQDWFSAFDAYVSAARSEPFGLVFLEAFAAGLPVLATASQGARHFEHLIATPLLPPGDVEAMKQALSALVAQRPARRCYDLQPYACAAKVAEVEAFYRRELAAVGLNAAG